MRDVLNSLNGRLKWRCRDVAGGCPTGASARNLGYPGHFGVVLLMLQWFTLSAFTIGNECCCLLLTRQRRVAYLHVEITYHQ